jgi:hypothetical protein
MFGHIAPTFSLSPFISGSPSSILAVVTIIPDIHLDDALLLGGIAQKRLLFTIFILLG